MSHYVDEVYSVYSVTPRTARKPRACAACRETIEVGHVYVHVFIVFDGNARHLNRCARCERIFDAVAKRIGPDGEWPDERLNCGHEWEEPPAEIARLAFLTQDEAQRELVRNK